MTKYTDLVTEVTAQVQANSDAVDSAIVLLGKIHDLLQAGVDNQDFSAISNVIKMLKDKDVELANAVVTNTPADPADPANGAGPVVAVPPDQTPGDGQVNSAEPAVTGDPGGSTPNAGGPGSTDTGSDAETGKGKQK